MDILAGVLAGNLVFGLLSESTVSSIDHLVATLVSLAGAVITTAAWRLLEKYLPSKKEEQHDRKAPDSEDSE